MSRLSNIIPGSDLRQNAAKLLKQLKESNEPLIITQRGRAAAVMIGAVVEIVATIVVVNCKGDRATVRVSKAVARTVRKRIKATSKVMALKNRSLIRMMRFPSRIYLLFNCKE